MHSNTGAFECDAVDAGLAMVNINEGFTGSAPDLGAHENGLALMHYGPRVKLDDLIFTDGFDGT